MRNRQVIDAAFRRAGAQPTVVLDTDSVFSLYTHVSEAGLFSIVPHSLLSFLDLGVRVQARPLLPPLTRAIGLIARNRPALAPVTGAVWNIARQLNLQARFDLALHDLRVEIATPYRLRYVHDHGLHHSRRLPAPRNGPRPPRMPRPPQLGERADALLGHAGGIALPGGSLAEAGEIKRVHGSEYVDRIFKGAPNSGYVQLDPDTAMNPHSLAAARRAAGAGLLAVDEVMAGRSENAFCAIRPCGHHATPIRSMGFCIFNNIGVAAAYALEKKGLDRVAIIDFDVHHGNGTEDMFSAPQWQDRVLMTSFFQHPFYPYSGTAHPAPNMINVPLPRAATAPPPGK